MSIEIVPLTDAHLPDAAALVASRYRELRDQVPLLPASYGAPEVMAGLLARLLPHVPGAAALRHGRLAGFMAGYLIPEFRGRPGVYCPEWAHAVEPEQGRRTYEEMYTWLAERWVASGYVQHALALLAHDQAAFETWHWLGFGLVAADAARGLDPVSLSAPDVSVRQAAPSDLDVVAELLAGLQRHLAASPTFLMHPQTDPHVESEEWLSQPRMAVWLAHQGAQPVGLMVSGPATDNASTIIVDPGTCSITGAYTLPQARGRDVGSALLNSVLAWARHQGYVRCCVDFEPMNTLAARFWTRHFQLTSAALFRHVDDRAATQSRALGEPQGSTGLV